MKFQSFCCFDLCVDYWLLLQESVKAQIRKFEFETLAKEKLRLDREYDGETYFDGSQD